MVEYEGVAEELVAKIVNGKAGYISSVGVPIER